MNIIFITHDFSRTGAPFVLYNFLKWLKSNTKISFELVAVNKKGDLENKFSELCPVYFWNAPVSRNSLFSQVSSKVKSKYHQRRVLVHLAKKKFTHIYANTIASLPLSIKLRNQIPGQCKVVAHIHELKVIIESILPDFKEFDIHVNHYIAASELVKNQLVSEWAIDGSKVTRVYECSTNNTESRLKGSLQFIIGGSGEVHWRKGTDLFLQVAKYVTSNTDYSIKFVWVGGINRIERLIADEDLRKLGISDKVHFTGVLKNPMEAFSEFDVFLMTSREDPFPLVCIEIGRMGIPIICFQDATGTEEILKNGGGKIVPYLDIEAMGNEVIAYLNNKQNQISDGIEAKSLFSEFSPHKICPQLLNVISNL